MPAIRRWIPFISALAVLTSPCLAETAPASQSSPAKTTHHRKSAHKPAPPPLVLPPLPAGPLPQMPMDLLPSAAPKVGFQGGLLTIVAQNSTLGDILREVHKLTGASMDVPPNANERVVTRLGPGAPRDVLAALLNGSSFNYVMLGSNADPAAVTSVVLTAKSTTNQGTAANTPPGQGFPYNPQPTASYVPPPVVPQAAAAGQPPAATDDNANADDAEGNGDDNADQEQGQADPNATAQPEPQQPAQPGQPNAGPRTPEQILEMLRRQQQSPGTPNPQQPPEN